MGTHTFSGSISDGIILTTAGNYLSPFTVTQSGTVSGAEAAIYSSIINPGIVNEGLVESPEFGIFLSDGGTVFNSGLSSTISGGYYGVVISGAPGSVVNDGTILGGVALSAGYVGNIGTASYIEGYVGIGGSSATLVNQGTIGGVVLSGSNANRLIVDPGGTFTGFVEASYNYISASNILELAAGTSAAGGTLTDLGQILNFDTIDFDSGSQWLLSGPSGGFDGRTINGFVKGDVLDITGATTDVSSTETLGPSDILHVPLGGGSNFPITFSSTDTGAVFTFTSDGSGGTDITDDVTCYVAGTRILTRSGEIAIEALKIGDTLETLHAGLQRIKWIGMREYDGRFVAQNRKVLPVCIKQNAISENVPVRDLWVSPGHAICIDGTLVHAFRLVNGVSIVQAIAVDKVTYFHIEMETHEVIFAEKCPAETFMDEVFRKQFNNSAEFTRLYPGEKAAHVMCLPRLDHGFLLEAIQRRLAARAGIPVSRTVIGPLLGYIDQAGPDVCRGWAQDLGSPEEPVCLDIFVARKRIGRVLANLYRVDLRTAGLGSGCHAFEFFVPSGITGPIQVFRSADGAELCLTEIAKAA